MAMMATQFWWWLALRRRSREDVAGAGGDQPPTAIPRTSGDPLERLIVEHLCKHGADDRALLIATLTGWIARQERSIGGGALDLVVFPDAMWREEAVRALARLGGDLIPAPGACAER